MGKDNFDCPINFYIIKTLFYTIPTNFNFQYFQQYEYSNNHAFLFAFKH